MDNIRVIKTGIDVSKILEQLEQFPEDWGAQKNIKDVGDLVEDKHYGFPKIEAGVLQMIMGGIEKQGDYVGDTEICVPTPAFFHHTEVINVLKKYVKTISRCGFLSLPVGGEVGIHIDKGTYYLTRDRYHLSIQGTYDYTVGGETVRVEPGTLLWFNNKLPHGTKNVGDCIRITFVFDVKHNPSNP